MFAAAASARELGDADRLARAALILAGGPAPTDTTVPVELVALLDEALDAIGDEPSALRARLMSGLAVQLHGAPMPNGGGSSLAMRLRSHVRPATPTR